MLLDRPLPGRAAARHALLCLLLLGLLLHAQAGVLRQLLGAAHWHVPMVAAAGPSVLQQPAVARLNGWLEAVRTWRQQLVAHKPLVGGHAQPGHHHAGTERHHHGAEDASVVALEPDDGGDSLSDGVAGSLLQPLALAGRLGWPASSQATPRWPHAATPAWRSASTRQPERPPRG